MPLSAGTPAWHAAQAAMNVPPRGAPYSARGSPPRLASRSHDAARKVQMPMRSMLVSIMFPGSPRVW